MTSFFLEKIDGVRMYNLSENEKINSVLNDVVNRVNKLAEEQLDHINRLSNIGLALSQERDADKIFDLIIEEALAYTNADAATIYSVSDDKKFLNFEVMQTKSKNLRAGGSFGPILLPPVPLYKDDKSPNLSNMASCVFHSKEMLNIEDCYDENRFDFSGTKAWDKSNNYRSKSMLAIPLKNYEDEILGIIQIINALDTHTSEIITFKKESIVMVQSLASQAAITFTNRQLIKSLEKLFKQFIKAIALAIDRKSKDTGGHIARVAIISKLMAKKINEIDFGHFKDFSFTDDELDELSVASWLHDVGKIATPDNVMNKASKLERITNGLEIIDLRLDTIYSLYNQEAYVKKAFASKENFDYLQTSPPSWELYREEIFQQLTEDYSFLKATNLGGEFLSDDKIARIDRISTFTYQVREEKKFLINSLENENLKIKRGTLNDQERQIMNNHVKYTYEILNQLTYPKKFKNVTLFASSHHERLDGSGHPWGFTEEQLPMQSRILAISDIFEALTAPDRPYKKGKKLSEAMNILMYNVLDNHIDKDLFEFLLDSGLYKEYAEKYVPAIQIDEVDIETIKKKIQKND